MTLGDLSWETIALALLVGLIAGIVGLSLRYGLQTWLDEFGLFRELFAWLRGRALEPRVTAAPWFCAECHSANPDNATHCYRGCGIRDDLEDLDPLGAHTPASAARRRG